MEIVSNNLSTPPTPEMLLQSTFFTEYQKDIKGTFKVDLSNQMPFDPRLERFLGKNYLHILLFGASLDYLTERDWSTLRYRLSSQKPSEKKLHQIYTNLKDTDDYNHNHFFGLYAIQETTKVAQAKLGFSYPTGLRGFLYESLHYLVSNKANCAAKAAESVVSDLSDNNDPNLLPLFPVPKGWNQGMNQRISTVYLSLPLLCQLASTLPKS